jgi:hypothetical protein
MYDSSGVYVPEGVVERRREALPHWQDFIFVHGKKIGR